jgi:hypothetical protein
MFIRSGELGGRVREQLLRSLRRQPSKDAPGLAFETWDPSNQCFMDTRDVTTGSVFRSHLGRFMYRLKPPRGSAPVTFSVNQTPDH